MIPDGILNMYGGHPGGNENAHGQHGVHDQALGGGRGRDATEQKSIPIVLQNSTTRDGTTIDPFQCVVDKQIADAALETAIFDG